MPTFTGPIVADGSLVNILSKLALFCWQGFLFIWQGSKLARVKIEIEK
jgi:hypothetical protein